MDGPGLGSHGFTVHLLVGLQLLKLVEVGELAPTMSHSHRGVVGAACWHRASVSHHVSLCGAPFMKAVVFARCSCFCLCSVMVVDFAWSQTWSDIGVLL